MRERQNYSLDFKRAVVRELHESGKMVKQVADKYNLNANTLCQWRTRLPSPKKKKAVAAPAPAPAPLSAGPSATEVDEATLRRAVAVKTRILQDVNYEGAARCAKAEARVEVLEATLKVWQQAYADLLQHIRTLSSVALPPPPDADATTS